MKINEKTAGSFFYAIVYNKGLFRSEAEGWYLFGRTSNGVAQFTRLEDYYDLKSPAKHFIIQTKHDGVEALYKVNKDFVQGKELLWDLQNGWVDGKEDDLVKDIALEQLRYYHGTKHLDDKVLTKKTSPHMYNGELNDIPSMMDIPEKEVEDPYDTLERYEKIRDIHKLPVAVALKNIMDELKTLREELGLD